MKRTPKMLLWLIVLPFFILDHAQACAVPPTTIGAYYSGSLLVGSFVVFTGAQSHDNDAINGSHTPRWEWDFDYHGTFQVDLNTTGAYPSNSYSQAGVYTVAVKYYDNDNQAGNLHTFEIMINGLKRLYYLKDHLGTIRATVDAAGQVVSADDYDPWGMVLDGRSVNYADANPKFRFLTKEHDIETGYDWLDARGYDARIGRFLTIDLLAQKFAAWSPYHYSFCDPMRYKDPTGMEPENDDPEEERKKEQEDKAIERTGNILENARNLFESVFGESGVPKENAQITASSASNIVAEVKDGLKQGGLDATVAVSNVSGTVETVTSLAGGLSMMGGPTTAPLTAGLFTVSGTAGAVNLVAMSLNKAIGGETYGTPQIALQTLSVMTPYSTGIALGSNAESRFIQQLQSLGSTGMSIMEKLGK